jgi:hypothetical protein
MDYASERARADAEMDALDRAERADQCGSPQAWERQPQESPKAFEAFRKYRDLASKRTLREVAQMSGCSAQNIERWSRKWNWVGRCYQFDLVEEERFREQTARDRMAHRRRQIQLGAALQSVAAHAVVEMQRRIEMQLPLGMSPIEVAAWLKLGDELTEKGLGIDKDGASRFTRINVVLGTAPDIEDVPAESRSALSDDTTGEGFELEPKPN